MTTTIEKWDCSKGAHDPEWDGGEWRCNTCKKRLSTSDAHNSRPITTTPEFARGQRDMLDQVLNVIDHQISKAQDYEHSDTWECALRLLKGRVKHLA